jgi:hypothetical protein
VQRFARHTRYPPERLYVSTSADYEIPGQASVLVLIGTSADDFDYSADARTLDYQDDAGR